MVQMPNLINLLKTAATQAITNAGLKVGTISTTDTSDIALSDKVQSQSIPAGQLVDYETEISFTHYNYVAPPYSFTPFSFVPYSFTPQDCTPESIGTQIKNCGGYNVSVEVFRNRCTQEETWTCPDCTPVYQGSQLKDCNGVMYYVDVYRSDCDGIDTWTCPEPQTWYCSVSYYGQMPSEYFISDHNETAQFCSMYNIVCSTSNYPPIPPKPPACQTYSFTPYSFVPYSFTPDIPPAYTFTPTVYTFTPYSFTPVEFSFTPLTVCVDEDTPVMVVGENDEVTHKAAKYISAGDYVWSMKWDQLLDESVDPLANQKYDGDLSGVEFIKTQITSVEESVKTNTIYFNNDISKRFTLEEKIFIRRGTTHMFEEAKNVLSGDYIFEVNNGTMVPVEVFTQTVVDQTRRVFRFAASPVDIIIAGGMVVHNSKTF